MFIIFLWKLKTISISYRKFNRTNFCNGFQLENKSFQFVKKQNLKEFAIPSLINKIIKYLQDEKLF